MRITLTTFVDFVIASGPTKLAVIHQAKKRYEADYTQASDAIATFVKASATCTSRVIRKPSSTM